MHYPKLVEQYLGIGLPFIFLGLISTAIALREKDKIFITLSIYPLIADIIIFLSLKTILYHYFLISLPLYVMSISKAFSVCKDRVIRIAMLAILFLSIISNFQTFDFYLNPRYAERYYEIADFIKDRTLPNESIFGEPVITNYVSFVTNRRISSNYLDSYLRHLVFEDEKNVIKNLDKDKPRIIIEMDGYYLSNPHFRNFILNNYVFERRFEGTPNYSIYRLK
jgi:hypothetical protein